MRLMICLGLAFCGSLLQAQLPASISPTAQLLQQRLREIKGGLLVVLDGPKGEWKTKVDALTSDPDWLDLDLRVSYYGSKAAELEVFLHQKYQTGPCPQWVLFGEGGRVVASGGSAPDPKALAKAVQEAGIRSELQTLREFTRRNPEHLDGRQALCSMLRKKASSRTLARLGEKADPIRPADERFDFAQYQKDQDAKEEAKINENKEDKPINMLNQEEDKAIWGELTDLLTTAFRSGDWIEMQNWPLVPDETAVHSSLMQEMSRAAVPEVERALGRSPGSWNLWQMWLGLTKTFGGKPIRPLLDSLVPLPTLAPTAWPPYAVRAAYVKDARKRKDWVGIRDLLLPQIESSRLWEEAQGRTTYVIKTGGKVQESPETGDYWRSILEPLAEALICLGDMGQADDLVRDRFAKHPWSGLPKRAEALALRCGQPGLAAQWGALGSGM